RPLNDWLTAMVVLFRPQIEELLIERDRVVLQWQAEHADTDVFEDRRLEIVSSIRISLHNQIEWLDRQLDASQHPFVRGPSQFSGVVQRKIRVRRMIMPFLPSLPKGASLLDLFKAFPETSIPLIQFHEALLRLRRRLPKASAS